MSNFIHIVCLDAPSPPDYGGAIDMYYKIKSLAEAEKHIILHYFNYNEKRNAGDLQSVCAEVNAYERKSFVQSLSFSQPYIVSSRNNQRLINRLNEDEYPILLEGLHCAGIIPYIRNKKRIVLRMHNEEASYYQHLFACEKNILRKTYFGLESKLISQFQQKIDKQVKLACLSKTDLHLFRNNYHFQNCHFIPCFIPWQQINSKTGQGNYCLYHGNLSVSENVSAALWLMQNVFSEIPVRFIIAGKSAPEQLFAAAKKYGNVSVISNPSIEQVDELIANAHINVLPSMNSTGVKLKLLHALCRGRFCITNTAGVAGSNIESGVHIANEPGDYIALINQLMQQDFSVSELQQREMILQIYNNQINAENLIAIWKHCQ